MWTARACRLTSGLISESATRGQAGPSAGPARGRPQGTAAGAHPLGSAQWPGTKLLPVPWGCGSKRLACTWRADGQRRGVPGRDFRDRHWPWGGPSEPVTSSMAGPAPDDTGLALGWRRVLRAGGRWLRRLQCNRTSRGRTPTGSGGQDRGNNSGLHAGAEAGGFPGQVGKHRRDSQICSEGDANNLGGCCRSGTLVVGDSGSELPNDS